MLRANQHTLVQLRKKGDVSKNTHSITLIPYEDFLRFFIERQQNTPSSSPLQPPTHHNTLVNQSQDVLKTQSEPITRFPSYPPLQSNISTVSAPLLSPLSSNPTSLKISHSLVPTSSSESTPTNQISRKSSLDSDWTPPLTTSIATLSFQRTPMIDQMDEMELDKDEKEIEPGIIAGYGTLSVTRSEQKRDDGNFPPSSYHPTTSTEQNETKELESPSRNEQMRGKEWLKLVLN
jgi:hypothetical protein